MKQNACEHQPCDLECALVAATFDQSARPYFYKILCGVRVFAGLTGGEGRRPKFAAVKRGNVASLAVFTSENMVPKNFEKMQMNFGEFLDMTRGECVCLNPGQAVTKDFSAEEIGAILSGALSSPDVFSSLGIEGAAHRAVGGQTKKHWTHISSLLGDHPGIRRAAGGELALDGGGTGVWVGLDSETDYDWEDAARECSVLLSTLDDAPDGFSIVRMREGEALPLGATVFFKSDEGGARNV